MKLQGEGLAPVLLGLSGPTLLSEEREYIVKHRPLGFLLFARNIESIEQTTALCAELTELSALQPPMIAVDQEGGRVQRLHFRGRLPAAQVFGEWYQVDKTAALEGVRLSTLLLAAQLREVGATWQLAPALDLAHPNTHAVIGTRAFSSDPEVVVELARAYAQGVKDGGCLGCIKHAPGHGRTVTDSHDEMPLVDAPLDALKSDLLPFERLAPENDFIMTAHIRYTALDNENPATYSPKILKMMREDWNFEGLIMADDVGMKALQGDYVERIRKALAAGCDFAIASFSLLRLGMAGTVFDRENFDKLRAATLPPLNAQAVRFLEKLSLPEAATAERVAEARARLTQLWADGPARMGYKLEL